ncbi:MAG TPA: hypothetical protein ENN39_10710 [Desulfonatronum sp.]|nr:hypothetical protein [Desulfonatronum sp.]
MNKKPRAKSGRGILWVVALFMGLCTLGLALSVVWINIERMDLAYELKQLQTELERKTDLQAKLEVERMNLLSSARLRSLAEEAGLRQAGPGQIRSMSH